MKKTLKIAGFSILTLILLLCFYLLAAYMLSRITVDKEDGTTEDVVTYILTNGVHTDLVLPIRNDFIDWSSQVGFHNTLAKDTTAQFVAFGWGDKGFYLETPTWADLKFSTAFKAAFGLSTSAIHATFYKNITEGDDCKKIILSKQQYERLVTYIKNSFSTNEKDQTIPIQTNANYGLHDAFYEAKGSYSLFHTCNTWANNGLKECGQKASWWTPFDTGIFYHYTQNK